MITWPNFVSQLFNGLALGALLALISSGLTIIYGTLGVLNLAHGAMFMLGGYAGYVAYEATGSFIVAVIAGSLFLVLVGGIMERLIIRYFYDRPIEDQLLVTFGLAICFVEVVRFFFGSLSKTVPPPPTFAGITKRLLASPLPFPCLTLTLKSPVAIPFRGRAATDRRIARDTSGPFYFWLDTADNFHIVKGHAHARYFVW
jgi:branched-subunit amino acid ABC-type transport system permease component